MKKLVFVIKLINSKSKAEKVLLKIVNNTTFDMPRTKYIDTLIHECKEASHTNENPIHLFVKILQKQSDWLPITKLLLMAHICLLRVGDTFAEEYLTLTFDQFEYLLKEAKEIHIREYTFKVLINAYHKYLWNLAYSYNNIKRCRLYSIDQIMQAIDGQNTSVLEEILVMNQILKSILKIKDCIVGTIAYKANISQMIGALLLQDAIEFYNILAKIVRASIESIFDVHPQISFYLDAFYSDLIKFTKPLKEFENFKGEFMNIGIPKVEYFQVDINFNKKEEKYIESLKANHNPNPILQRQKTKGLFNDTKGLLARQSTDPISLEIMQDDISKFSLINKKAGHEHTKFKKDDYYCLEGDGASEIGDRLELISPNSSTNMISVSSKYQNDSPLRKSWQSDVKLDPQSYQEPKNVYKVSPGKKIISTGFSNSQQSRTEIDDDLKDDNNNISESIKQPNYYINTKKQPRGDFYKINENGASNDINITDSNNIPKSNQINNNINFFNF